MTLLADPRLQPVAGPFGPRLRRHLRELATLAAPVMLSRAGMLLLAMADFMMAGRAGVAELNAVSLGFAIFMPLMVAGVGLMLGVISVASRRIGAGDHAGAAAAWAQGMHLALAAGLAGWALCAQGGTMLGWFGQSETLAADGGRVAAALGPGLPAQLIFMVCAFYLESAGRAAPALIAMAAANAVNLGLNALWIPEMGGAGAAWASSAARWAMALGMLGYVLRQPAVRALGRAALRPWGPGGWDAAREMRGIGMAGGAAGFFETMAFASLAQAAGLAGADVLAAYSVAHSVESLVFMTALGVATAAGVRVGAAMGAGRADEAAFAGWTGLGAAMAVAAAMSGLMLAFAPQVAGIYVSDPAVIARVSAAFAIVAVSLVFDAGQVVLGQCVRALGDTWIGAAIFFLAFFGVMAPLGWTFTLALGWGERGLFIATALGCITAISLLSWRFTRLVARRGK